MEEILVSLQNFFYKIYSLLFTNNIAFIFKNQIVKKFLFLPLVLFKGCCKVKDFNLFRNRNNERVLNSYSCFLHVFLCTT